MMIAQHITFLKWYESFSKPHEANLCFSLLTYVTSSS